MIQTYFFELEESTQTVDEAQTHVAPANIDEALCDKLLNSPSPKVSMPRTGVKSTFMEQMMLLKMDPRRLKEKPENRSDHHTHECKHCGKLIKILHGRPFENG